MIEIFKPNIGKLEVLDKPVKKTWINISSPDENDILNLKSIIDIPEEVLFSLKDIDEIPTIEEHTNFTFIIIRTPQKNSNGNELEYSTVPLGIILSEDYMISICFAKNDVIERLKCQKFGFKETKPILRLLLLSAKLYLNYLKEINKEIYIIQKDLERSTKNEEIIKLLGLEKSLVYFNTSLKSNTLLIKRLSKNEKIIKSYESKKIMENIIDENIQASEMTAIYSNILSSMMDAFASVISNNLNTVIKLLTSITIILMIPTLAASIYGMNVPLPFQNSPHAFLITMIISLFFSVLGILIFWRRELF